MCRGQLGYLPPETTCTAELAMAGQAAQQASTASIRSLLFAQVPCHSYDAVRDLFASYGTVEVLDMPGPVQPHNTQVSPVGADMDAIRLGKVGILDQ